jgi:hypothetical protein
MKSVLISSLTSRLFRRLTCVSIVESVSECENLCACGCGAPTRIRGNRYVHGHNRRGTGRAEGWIDQGMHFVRVEGKPKAVHRLVVEQRLGRPLGRDEIVVHLDGNLLNNGPYNLVVVSRDEHFRESMRAEMRDPWSEDEVQRALRLYADDGLTIDEVARSLGRPYHATRRLLSRWR